MLSKWTEIIEVIFCFLNWVHVGPVLEIAFLQICTRADPDCLLTKASGEYGQNQNTLLEQSSYHKFLK